MGFLRVRLIAMNTLDSVAGEIVLKMRADRISVDNPEVVSLNAAFDEDLPVGVADDIILSGDFHSR